MIYTMDWFFNETFTDIIKILLSIDSIIYWLVAQFFRFAIDISSADFVMTDLLTTIIERAYVVVGIFALFVVSYALIKGMFDPDGAFKGKNSLGTIVKNLLTAIALVALMPTIFQYLFRFQAIIINNNVIGNIVLGNDSKAMNLVIDGKEVPVTVDEVGYNNYVKIAANNVAFTAMNAFIYADDNDKAIDLSEKVTVGTFLTPHITEDAFVKVVKAIYQKATDTDETTFNKIKNETVLSGNFLNMNNLAYHVATGGDYKNGEGAHITYLFIISTICGIVLVGLAFTFCINIVIRMFNLFLLELISPIASFSLIIPNSKIFDNWLKATMKEYLDLFVRLFVFNLAILFFSNINEILRQVFVTGSILNILFVIGLLIFVNEAPKLVKDIIGIKDDKKGIKDRLFSGGVAKTLGGAAGLLGGGAVAGMGIASSLMDKNASSGWGKAWNAVKGGAKGVEAGRNAAKTKNLGGFFDSVDKGVKASATSRHKADERGARYKAQYGAGLSGIAKGLGHDAMYYATDTNPTDSYNKYVEQRFHGKMKDANDKLNDSVAKAKTTLATNQVFGGETFNAGDEINIGDLNTRRESAELAYKNALAGNHKDLQGVMSEENWGKNYLESIVDNQKKALDAESLSLNPGDRARLMDLANEFTTNMKNGVDNTLVADSMKDVVKLSSDEMKTAVNNFINSASKSTMTDAQKAAMDSAYASYANQIETSNNNIIANLKAQADRQKNIFEDARDFVINENVLKDGSTKNIMSDLVLDIKNSVAANPYIDLQGVTINDSSGTPHTINSLQDQAIVDLLSKDHKFMRDVIKEVKKRQETFENTDTDFKRAREMRNRAQKDK